MWDGTLASILTVESDKLHFWHTGPSITLPVPARVGRLLSRAARTVSSLPAAHG